MKNKLLERGNDIRQKIYDFLVEFFKNNGFAPSVREIGEAVGLNSTSTVTHHLEKLEKDGKIEMKGKAPRAIRLVGYAFVKVEEYNTVI